jgi:hypothetical protein
LWAQLRATLLRQRGAPSRANAQTEPTRVRTTAAATGGHRSLRARIGAARRVEHGARPGCGILNSGAARNFGRQSPRRGAQRVHAAREPALGPLDGELDRAASTATWCAMMPVGGEVVDEERAAAGDSSARRRLHARRPRSARAASARTRRSSRWPGSLSTPGIERAAAARRAGGEMASPSPCRRSWRVVEAIGLA